MDEASPAALIEKYARAAHWKMSTSPFSGEDEALFRACFPLSCAGVAQPFFFWRFRARSRRQPVFAVVRHGPYARAMFPHSAYRKLEQQISGMSMEDMDDFLHEEPARTELSLSYNIRTETPQQRSKKTNVRETYADDFEQYYDIYEAGGFLKYGETLAQEYRFLNTIVLEFEQVNGYEEFLTSIEQKARQFSSISTSRRAKADTTWKTSVSQMKRSGICAVRPFSAYPQKGIATGTGF